MPIVTFWKGYLIRLNPKMFIFYLNKSAVHRFELYKTFLQNRQGVIELWQVLHNDLDIAPTYEN